MDGWLTWHFTTFLTVHVFQSYQNPAYTGKDFPFQWVSNLGLLDQQASAEPTVLQGLPELVEIVMTAEATEFKHY